MKSSYLKIFLVLYLIEFCFAIHIPVNGISYTCKEKRVCENCVCNPIGTVIVDDVVEEVGKTDTEYACMQAVAVLASVSEGVTGYFSWNEDDEICSMCAVMDSVNPHVVDPEELTDVFEVTCSEDSDEKFMDAVGVTSIIVLVVSICSCICLTAINKCRAEEKAQIQMDFQKVVNASRSNLKIDDASDDEDGAETNQPRPASIPTKTSQKEDETALRFGVSITTKANDNKPMDG